MISLTWNLVERGSVGVRAPCPRISKKVSAKGQSIHHENENKCTDQHATTSPNIILSWFIVYLLASKWNQVQKYTWAGRIAI